MSGWVHVYFYAFQLEQTMKEQIVRFLKDEDGATAIEYGLIAGLIAVVIIAALTALGKQLDTTFESISGAISGAAGEGAKD